MIDTTNRRIKGSSAESAAEEFLTAKGFTLISKNFHASTRGEIDLIMYDNDFIVFIEVKSVSIKSRFSIYETLTKNKKLRIKKSILTWLDKHNNHNAIWRFDFVGVITGKEEVLEIEHFEFVEL